MVKNDNYNYNFSSLIMFLYVNACISHGYKCLRESRSLVYASLSFFLEFKNVIIVRIHEYTNIN